MIYHNSSWVLTLQVVTLPLNPTQYSLMLTSMEASMFASLIQKKHLWHLILWFSRYTAILNSLSYLTPISSYFCIMISIYSSFHTSSIPGLILVLHLCYLSPFLIKWIKFTSHPFESSDRITIGFNLPSQFHIQLSTIISQCSLKVL